MKRPNISTHENGIDRATSEEKSSLPTISCGLIMPISPLDGCGAEHWGEVKEIICDALEEISDYKVETKLVSDADDIGVIQRRIVQNVYGADIIICDVSGKNPNVMFELGLRLAFDKPTVIIKDDKTDYSFDTAVIEHLNYPRDLRFKTIQIFKSLLAQKVRSTYLANKTGEHSTFLKNFGTFHVAKISDEPLSLDKVVLASIEEMRADLGMMRRNMSRIAPSTRPIGPTDRNGAILGRQKIRDELLTWKNTSPAMKFDNIMNDEKLMSKLAEEIAAEKYFRNGDEFKDNVVRSIIELDLL
jgi:hypothetical protein